MSSLVEHKASFGIPVWDRVDLYFQLFFYLGFLKREGSGVIRIKREMRSRWTNRNLLWGRPLRGIRFCILRGRQSFLALDTQCLVIFENFHVTGTLTSLHFSLGKDSIWSLEQLPQFTSIYSVLTVVLLNSLPDKMMSKTIPSFGKLKVIQGQ